MEEREKIEREEDTRKAEEFVAGETLDAIASALLPMSATRVWTSTSRSPRRRGRSRSRFPQCKTASQKAMEFKECDVRVLIGSM